MASLTPPPPPLSLDAKRLAARKSSSVTEIAFDPSLSYHVLSPPSGNFTSNEIKKRASVSDSNALLPIPLLQNCSTMDDARQIQAHLIKSNAIQDALCFFKLLTFCASAWAVDFDYAQKLFFSYPHRNSVFWNILIYEYSQSPMLDTSMLLFIKLIEEDPILLNPYTFPPLLKACAKVSALLEGMQIHSYAIKCGMIIDSYVQNSLIQMYFGCGRHSIAHLMFDKMPERSVVTWNCVIAGYSKSGLWEKVISLFWMMIEEALVEPNLVTLTRVVTACTKCGDFYTGKIIYSYIAENGAPLWLNLGNALINMFMKFGDIKLARELFDKLPNPDVISLTTLISGYSSIGLIREAREVFDKMPGRNIVAWNAMMAGYVFNGFFEEALLLYKQMLWVHLRESKHIKFSICFKE